MESKNLIYKFAKLQQELKYLNEGKRTFPLSEDNYIQIGDYLNITEIYLDSAHVEATMFGYNSAMPIDVLSDFIVDNLCHTMSVIITNSHGTK